ncbi:hypothetical protein ACVILK_007482 [Bradyrhizobium embrapense]
MTRYRSPNLLGLGTRTDLVFLSDEQLGDRLERAMRADDNARKRLGWQYYTRFLSWSPRLIVEDPYDYWFPEHIMAEIRDVTKEIERRLSVRKQMKT